MLVPSVLKSSKISVGHCLNYEGTGIGPNWKEPQMTTPTMRHARRSEAMGVPLLPEVEEVQRNVQGTGSLVSEAEEMALRCPPEAAKRG